MLSALRTFQWHRVCELSSSMLLALESHAVLLLTLAGVLAAAPASACNLGHCPRPKPALRENPSLGVSVDHADAVDGDPGNAFTQASLHARLPLGSHWAL